MPPSISVVIPAFNAEKYLGEALDSVFSQSLQPQEVIVVDDGSTDSTFKVAARYGNKVRYIYKQNGGPSSSRNLGIRTARGEWIAFLDSDDIWMPHLLKTLADAAMATEMALVFGDARIFRNDDVVGPTLFERSGLKRLNQTHGPNQTLSNPFALLLELDQFILPSAVLVRKDAVLKVGMFDEALHCVEDLELWLRLSLRYSLAFVDEVLLLRRLHDSNLTRDEHLILTGKLQVFERLENNYPHLLRKDKCFRALRKEKAGLLRELGAIQLERGEIHLARRTWNKGLRTCPSTRLGAYWLSTFLPPSCITKLRAWKQHNMPAAVSSLPAWERSANAD